MKAQGTRTTSWGEIFFVILFFLILVALPYLYAGNINILVSNAQRHPFLFFAGVGIMIISLAVMIVSAEKNIRKGAPYGNITAAFLFSCVGGTMIWYTVGMFSP